MKWLFRSWRKFIAVDISKRSHTIVLVALLVTGGCATAVPHLWPPASGTPTKKIFISLDTWHAMIGFPQERQQDHQEITKPSEFSIQSSRQATFEEWGYAERAWYLEGQHGVRGIIRAMASPSEGIVEIAEYDQLWADRTPQPPADLFTFRLSEEGYQKLRNHLRSTMASTTPVARLGASRFYLASRPYSFSHHCHHYVAIALQKAGLPISTFWGLNRTNLATQLQEAEKLAEETVAMENK